MKQEYRYTSLCECTVEVPINNYYFVILIITNIIFILLFFIYRAGMNTTLVHLFLFICCPFTKVMDMMINWWSPFLLRKVESIIISELNY